MSKKGRSLKGHSFFVEELLLAILSDPKDSNEKIEIVFRKKKKKKKKKPESCQVCVYKNYKNGRSVRICRDMPCNKADKILKEINK